MKNDIDQTNAYYRVVDKLCAKKGITHRALAEEIGVNEVTLSRYLRGERSTTLQSFMAMCRVLEIDPQSLYKTYLYSRLEKRVADYRKEHEA